MSFLAPECQQSDFLSLSHFLQSVDGLGKVAFEVCVGAQIVGASLGQVLVEFGVHALHVLRDGIFDVVTLPCERGVDVDPQFLMEEAVGRLDAVFANHPVMV